jgi:hypothetical protein
MYLNYIVKRTLHAKTTHPYCFKPYTPRYKFKSWWLNNSKSAGCLFVVLFIQPTTGQQGSTDYRAVPFSAFQPRDWMEPPPLFKKKQKLKKKKSPATKATIPCSHPLCTASTQGKEKSAQGAVVSSPPGARSSRGTVRRELTGGPRGVIYASGPGQRGADDRWARRERAVSFALATGYWALLGD